MSTKCKMLLFVYLIEIYIEYPNTYSKPQLLDPETRSSK